MQETIVIAAQRGDIETISRCLHSNPLLTTEQYDNGESLLHLAALHGQKAVCEQLLARGAQLDALNDDRATPLLVALSAGHTDLAMFFLSNAANPNACDRDGKTPVWWAIAHRDLQLARRLLDDGAVDLRNRFTAKVLFHAANGDAEMIDLLISYAGDHGAAIQGAMIKAAKLGDVDFIARCLESNPSVATRRHYGSSLLHTAAYHGQNAVCELLLDRGAELEAMNGNGDTPLVLASSAGHVDLAVWLLSARASLDAHDYERRAPLWWAVEHRDLHLAELLLERGAEVDAEDKNGETALHRAARFDDETMAELLLKHGANVNAVAYRRQTPLDYAGTNGAAASVLRAYGGKTRAGEDERPRLQ